LGKPRSLAEVKVLADAYIDGSPQEAALRFALTFLNVPVQLQLEILERWRSAGSPPIRQLAPYFRYIFGVDLFFSLAIASDQISRVRPAGKADNKVDIAYLYYLPFCHVFTSPDNLHRRVVPLFLREDQTFVGAAELKADLSKLDNLYSALPDQVKAMGFHGFAAEPPEDKSFLVTRLWDKHLPQWRGEQEALGQAPGFNPPRNQSHSRIGRCSRPSRSQRADYHRRNSIHGDRPASPPC
jgi:hypothetical protein